MVIDNLGHMTKMVAMPIYVKETLNSSSQEPISTILDMKYLGLKYLELFINHDIVMTFTNFTAR